MTSSPVSAGLLALCAALACASTAWAEGSEKRWAVGMYLNGDNNLEKHIVHDLDEVLGVENRSDTHVRIDAMLDRAGEYDDKHNPGGPATGRFKLSDPKVVAGTPFGSHIGMALPANLRDFLASIIGELPQSRRALIIGAHGDGPRARAGGESEESIEFSTGPASLDAFADLRANAVSRGVLFDRTQDRYMTVEELGGAIRAAGKLDVLGFDACLMATVEVATSLTDVADYIVGSEHEEIPEGWNHAVWARQLFMANGDKEPKDLALSFLAAFESSGKTANLLFNTNTAVVISSANVPELVRHVNELASVLVESSTLSSWKKIVAAIQTARGNCPRLGTTIESNTVDLACFALGLRGKKSDVRQLLEVTHQERLDRSIDHIASMLCRPEDDKCKYDPRGSVIVGRALGEKAREKDMRGLAIYFPLSRATAAKDITLVNYRRGSARFFSLAPNWLRLIDLYQQSLSA